MTGMRVVKGNAVVLEEALPQGIEVDVVLREAGEEEAGVYVDHATEEELLEAMAEAETEDGVSVKEAFGRLPPRKRTP
jgi:hypothetical protein